MDLYFITGTSSGLGAAITKEALEQGHTVVGIGRNHSYEANRYFAVKADLSRPEVAPSITLGNPDPDQEYDHVVLINNAGIIEPVKHMGNADAATMQQHYQVNMVAPAIITNQFLAEWKDALAEKVILNISSGAAFRPIDGWGCYCSAKAGLAMLTQVIHEEATLDGVNCRAYALAPGVVDTPMQDTIRTADAENFSQLERFQQLKADDAMVSPAAVARKFLQAVNNQYENLQVLDRLN